MTDVQIMNLTEKQIQELDSALLLRSYRRLRDKSFCRDRTSEETEMSYLDDDDEERMNDEGRIMAALKAELGKREHLPNKTRRK